MNITPLHSTSRQAGRDPYTHTGTVKWYDDAKGFGFIQDDDASVGLVHVHYTGILGSGFRTLQEGARVGYDVFMGTKGPAAEGVRLLEASRRAA